MGVVNYNPQIDDDYSSEIIRIARERSTDIDDWITTEQFKCEIGEDSITPLWLRNKCIIKLIEELVYRGLAVNQSADDICDVPELVYTVLAIHKKFNDEELFRAMRDHNDLYDLVREDLGANTFTTIIEWAKRNLPLDDGWELIGNTLTNYPGIFDGDTPDFISLIQAIIDRVDALGEPSATVDVDQDLMLRYIAFLSKRAEIIRSTAASMFCSYSKTTYEITARRNMVDQVIDNGFEAELASRSNIADYASRFDKVDLKDPASVSEFLTDIRAKHVSNWSHCLEHYYGTEGKPCTECMLVVMLATIVVDCKYKLNLHTFVEAKLNAAIDQIGTDACSEISQRFKELLANLVTPPEVNYAIN